MRRLLEGNDPHKRQVRALRRLVCNMGDVIIAAKTGFGNSIVFRAFSVLTGQTSLQLIP